MDAFLRGQKSKNLQKMADFDHFSPFEGGQVGEEPPTGREGMPHLDAATAFALI